VFVAMGMMVVMGSAVFFGVARSEHYTLQFMCVFLAEQKLRMETLYEFVLNRANFSTAR
jgi:hypothetical protein